MRRSLTGQVETVEGARKFPASGRTIPSPGSTTIGVPSSPCYRRSALEPPYRPLSGGVRCELPVLPVFRLQWMRVYEVPRLARRRVVDDRGVPDRGNGPVSL